MELSLNILVRHLSKYRPVVQIDSASSAIKGIRLLDAPPKQDDSLDFDKLYLYSLPGEDCVIGRYRNDKIKFFHNSLTEISNTLLDIFNFYDTWFNDIASGLFDYSYDTLLEKFTKVLDCSLLFADFFTLSVSYAGKDAPDCLPFLDKISGSYLFNPSCYQKFADCTSGENSERPNPSSKRSCCFCTQSLMINHSACGLVVLFGSSISNCDLDLFQYIKKYSELWLQVHNPHTYSDTVPFITDILSCKASNMSDISTFLYHFNVSEGMHYYIYYTSLPQDIAYLRPAFSAQLMHSDARFHPWYDPENSAGIILLVTAELDDRAYIEQLLENYSSIKIRWGLSGGDRTLSHLQKRIHCAKIAAIWGNSSDGKIQTYESAILPYAADLLKKQDFLFVSELPVLRFLREYDELHRSSHLDYLKTYLECSLSKAETCRKLFISRSVLERHLDKIHELTGLNFEDSNVQLALRFSLFLLNGNCSKM